MFNFGTDLADERAEICKKINNNNIDGIKIEKKTFSNKVEVTKVNITNENGSKKIGKKIGNYITLDIKDINIITYKEINSIIKILSDELKKLILDADKILIVGLGNIDTTADSIGPSVIKDIEITRHLLKYNPELLKDNTKEVSAISPRGIRNNGN